MSPADLGFVVREHRRHFPHGFFARLGGGFLREYYRAFLTSAKSRTVVAELDGAPVGYLVGVTDPAAHRSHVVHRHGRVLVARAVAAMLVRPSLAFRFLRTRVGLYTRKLLRRGSRVSSGGSVEASDDGAGPYYRRRGWTPSGDRSTPDGLRLTTYERPVEATNDQDYPWRSEGTA